MVTDSAPRLQEHPSRRREGQQKDSKRGHRMGQSELRWCRSKLNPNFYRQPISVWKGENWGDQNSLYNAFAFCMLNFAAAWARFCSCDWLHNLKKEGSWHVNVLLGGIMLHCTIGPARGSHQCPWMMAFKGKHSWELHQGKANTVQEQVRRKQCPKPG